MNPIKSTGDSAAFARGADEHYREAIALCEEDGRLRAFKYLLLRLTVGGLRMNEVDELRKVGQAVFAGSDPGPAAQEVLSDTSSSPLAVVIAQAALKETTESRQRAVLGAVLGAHANIAMSGGEVDTGLAVFAATVAAATAETTSIIQAFVGNEWEQFGTRE